VFQAIDAAAIRGLRSNERAEDCAPLTAAASRQIIQLSIPTVPEAKGKKEKSARDKNQSGTPLHKITTSSFGGLWHFQK
jgi:hypothetical protein